MAAILAKGVRVPARVHSRCLALDHPGQPIYAIVVSRRDGFTKASFHPHPEAAVRISLLRLAVPLLLALSGCHLLDQTDFDPRMRAKPPPPPVPNPEMRAALVTIDYAKAEPDYRAALATAIQAAETKRPGSLYDVVAVVGDAGGAAVGQSRAAEVMTAIEADGVVAPRIQLGLAVDPGRKIPQVRVYLR
ncbi:MAG TPA: hypothetical protein VHX39_33905 [Acetobacteraceae bacterium]|jgi:hypothetical protein|nr:hypothetical protein [Acetobacteraceae bacterium]